MPELPEVETVRTGLESLILHTAIRAVDIRRDSCVRLLPGGASEFAAETLGLQVTEAARRGKFLWLTLADLADPGRPVTSLSAHLGMSGQFRVHDGAWTDAPEPHRHCRARLSLERADGAQLTLDFLDQRTFGYLHAEPFVATVDGRVAGQGTVHPLLPVSVAHIGRDALDPELDPQATARAWRRGSRGVKQVLLDQTAVSGIGNIYADEALWLARLHPERPAHAVTAPQARALLDAVRAVMGDALAQGGTSFDALYVNVNGESGYFDRSLHAYGRAGEPCDRCGRPLHRAVIGGRSTHWCATCQRRWVRKPRIDAV
ncbi:bifunctional DNA-formamidopyrimidine glycosylase/DNA-(apurinic or apyrimidinic site) lyase [Demequina zhanjiangensis]|uniref:Formamidopyrimidine-DNA glycosylase n=1 Tax=Demequina zhanjiangensis TaxID=3051659 RepID=A0ABT8G4S5_9MICO|nr:bifunctional DNA-formamidopyrimidine glycosylase/DNA-(apurinic or apyrimidinic site) lyase [Demequina sp. SYSU T00b26]MDN4474137.1 bifunctional DNA-formamidopyrimidine glycosylase/DNA-(apurinic or apyrimidinic site) lyase [Demequina sp. SYSU T00b26]